MEVFHYSIYALAFAVLTPAMHALWRQGEPNPGMQQQYCYSTAPDPFRKYALATAYDEARGHEVQEEAIPGCEAAHLYLYSRHGSRYPSTDFIYEMGEWLPTLQEHLRNNPNNLCQEDLAAIDSWTMRMTAEEDGMELANTGWTEFREMGKIVGVHVHVAAARYKQRYPDLLARVYTEDEFEFLHTETSSNRTRDSALAFAEGLFGVYNGVNVIENDAETDWLLLFDSLCDKYIDEVGSQPVEEQQKFLAGDDMAAVVVNVTERLGFSAGSLGFDDIANLYDICRFEYGVYRDSPWCATLTQIDLEVLEYNEDLYYYYTSSYGNEINYEMACTPIVDILEEWSNTLAGSQETLCATRYGHLTPATALYARLGLSQPDEHLLADDFEENDDRLFRLSIHSSMATNIVFVLYVCDDGDNRVKAFQNDIPITIPGCPADEDTCSYQQVLSLWSEWAVNCNMTTICDPHH